MERRRRGGASASNEETTHLLWEERSKSLFGDWECVANTGNPNQKIKEEELPIRLEPKQTEPKCSFFGFTFS